MMNEGSLGHTFLFQRPELEIAIFRGRAALDLLLETVTHLGFIEFSKQRWIGNMWQDIVELDLDFSYESSEGNISTVIQLYVVATSDDTTEPKAGELFSQNRNSHLENGDEKLGIYWCSYTK